MQKVCCAGEAEGWQLQEDAINVSLQGGHSHQRISYHPHAHCFRHLTTVHGYLKLVKQNNRTPCSFLLQNSSSTDRVILYPTPFNSLMINIALLPSSRPDWNVGETLWHCDAVNSGGADVSRKGWQLCKMCKFFHIWCIKSTHSLCNLTHVWCNVSLKLLRFDIFTYSKKGL